MNNIKFWLFKVDEIEEILMSVVAEQNFIDAQLGAKAITKREANKKWFAKTKEATQQIQDLISQQCNVARIDELERALSKSNTAWVKRGNLESHEDFVHSNILRDRLKALRQQVKGE